MDKNHRQAAEADLGRQASSISSRRAGLRPAGHGSLHPRRRPHRHRTRACKRGHHPEQPAIRRACHGYLTSARGPPWPAAKLAAPGATTPTTTLPATTSMRPPSTATPAASFHATTTGCWPAARAIASRETGPTQRSSCLDRGHYHPDRPVNRRRQASPAAAPVTHGRCDPHDQPRPPLLRKRRYPQATDHGTPPWRCITPNA